MSNHLLLMKAAPLSGKQFVVHRNPTVLGSAPKADVYLFKDESVEPRHALIHDRGAGSRSTTWTPRTAPTSMAFPSGGKSSVGRSDRSGQDRAGVRAQRNKVSGRETDAFEAAMPITFQCPNCGKRLKAPESAVGKSSTCPGCGQMVSCPDPVYEAEVVNVGGGDESHDVADIPPGAGSSIESRHPCPMCGELILAMAARCRFCGELFDPTLTTSNKQKKSRKYWPEDEELSGLELVLAALCSGIGCIIGLIWLIEGKPKGLKMIGVAIVADLVKCALIAVFEATQNGSP